MKKNETEEGVMLERYPHDDASASVQVASAYDEGFFDGFVVGMVVLGALAVAGLVLSVVL